MNKLELFVAGCKAERWRWRTWRASLFAVTSLNLPDEDLEKYDIDYREDGAVWWTGTGWEKVEDHNEFEALYDNRALANFPADSIPSNKEPIQTTYGRMLYNWCVLYYAFGSKIPFQHKATQKSIVKLFTVNAVDDDYVAPEGSSEVYYTASEISRFVQASNEITSICSMISPTGTDKSLTTDPRVPQRRAELLEEYKDKLTPSNITHIQNELIAMDKAWLKNDDASDFYLSGSAYNIKRKKLFLMHGIEASFQENGKFDFIPTSLSEGGDLDQITAKNNSIREGSFDRGNDTAFGGAKVVFLQRIHQNTTVQEGDCGTPLVQPKLLQEYNKHQYLGMNIMVDGKVTPLTEQVVSENLGKVVMLRRPILCKGINNSSSYCASCTSLRMAKTPRAIISEIAAVASNIMSAYMASMHGTELAVARYNFKLHIK